MNYRDQATRKFHRNGCTMPLRSHFGRKRGIFLNGGIKMKKTLSFLIILGLCGSFAFAAQATTPDTNKEAVKTGNIEPANAKKAEVKASKKEACKKNKVRKHKVEAKTEKPTKSKK